MSYTPIGLPVAKEVLEAMRVVTARFWYEWQVYYDRATQEQKEALQLELQQKLEACRVGAMSDGKVAVDAEDVPNADYLGIKLIAAAGATVTEVAGSHGQALAVGADLSDLDPLPDAVEAEPGTSAKVSRADHVHPTVPPVPTNGGGSWLYTGSIQATNLLDPVKAFVKSLEGMGGLDPGQAELWTVLPGGDYEHKVVGQVYGLAPDGTETFALSLGQRVWLATWRESASVYRGGLFTVTTLGDGSTKAVLHPVATELAVGDMFKVEGSGAQFENWYWEVLSLPDMLLAYRPDYVNATTYPLFTSTQVHLAGSTTREATVTIPGGTSGGTPFSVSLFEMIDGLNLTTIDKGVVNWEVSAYVLADDPAATIFVRANLSTNQGTDHNFGYADSPPIHNTSAAVLRFQGAIAADITVSPTDKLSAVFAGYSNSASPVTIKLVYNSADHITRVQTPIETASYGTLDHKLLDKASKGWATGQETFSALFEHPASTVCQRFPIDCSATIETGDGSGILVIPDTCSGPVRVTGTELKAIAVKDAAGNQVFGKLAGLRLHFSETCVVRHLDALVGATAPWLLRAGKLHLFPPPGAEGTDMDIQIPALRTARLYLDQPEGGVLTWYLEVMQ